MSSVTCHVSTQGDSGGSVLTSARSSEGEEVWSLAGVVSFGSSLGCEVRHLVLTSAADDY